MTRSKRIPDRLLRARSPVKAIAPVAVAIVIAAAVAAVLLGGGSKPSAARMKQSSPPGNASVAGGGSASPGASPGASTSIGAGASARGSTSAGVGASAGASSSVGASASAATRGSSIASPGQAGPHGVPAALGRRVGQMIVACFEGTTPPASLLRSIEQGRVGGVILFADNLTSEAQMRRLTSTLQRAARVGGNPPLLIMTDQEGGEVRRLPWAPPELAPAAMDSTAVAGAEGRATARALLATGVNVDLAPVADVIRVPDSFLGTRSFGANPATVAARACAFATGLASVGAAFTLKHFPGLGRALTSTDMQSTVIDATAGQLREDYGAYRRCGERKRALVMISSAIYPSLAGETPAVLARETYATELPRALGGREPLTISDNLQTPALLGEPEVPRRAAAAGLDLLLYASSEAGAATAYRELLAAARSGAVAPRRIESANEAIAKMKLALE